SSIPSSSSAHCRKSRSGRRSIGSSASKFASTARRSSSPTTAARWSASRRSSTTRARWLAPTTAACRWGAGRGEGPPSGRAVGVEEIRVPINCLDVLAQQIVALAALDDCDVPGLYALVRRAYPYRDLSPQAFEATLEMISGRYRLLPPASEGHQPPAEAPPT